MFFKEKNMLQLESKSLIEYYGINPQNYDLGFIHYQVDLLEETKEEYQLLEKDFDHIKEYVGEEKFKIYFSDIFTLEKIKRNTNIVEKYTDFIYLRIRNNQELSALKEVGCPPIKIIVDLSCFKNLDIKDLPYAVVLQVDTVLQLPISLLNELNKDGVIEEVLVGQICYLSDYFLDFLKRMANKFQVEATDYLAIEKNVLVANDFYSLATYEKILQALYELVKDISLNDKEFERFIKVYNRIVHKIFYDFEHLHDDLLENQNLLGGLLYNTCVCEGYTKILQQALSLLHIESIVVGGGGAKSEGGHLWNQVKIDGIWYNADATADSILVHRHESMAFCLVSDDKVYKSYYPSHHRCELSYQEKEEIKGRK